MAEENQQEQIYRSEGEFHYMNLSQNKDITPYVTSCAWAGSLECAARSVDFAIAYTTPKKDPDFQNLTIELGNRVQMRFVDKNGAEHILFEGNVFLRNRSSEGYTMEFKAFDNMIYLAKSEVQMKFSNMPAADIIRQVCAALGVTVGTIHEDFNVVCDFIADGMTGTEVINKCIERCEAQYGWRYKAVMLPDEKGQQVLNVVRADGTDIVANFKVGDTTNLERAQHGESIEDMVNQVVVVNDNGDITGYIKLEEEIAKYGMIQKVYKYNQKENTETAAKLLLQKVKEHSSLSALGNIQCVSGFVVEVEEEQIKGKFMIMSDNHRIENNQHHMELTLDFIVKPDSRVGATTEGNVNPTPTKKKGKANKNTKVGLKEGMDNWVGASTPYGSNGCVYAATGIASYYSPWAAEEFNNGVVNVPTLISDAQAAGMYERYGEGTLEPGDIIVYGDSHVVVSTGGNGYVGNSSSKEKVVKGKDFTNMGGQYATGIIKTSRQ